MRRVITGLLALALALITAADMKNADALVGNCRSVSLRYRQPLSAGQVEAAEEKQPGLTFWCEETAELDGGWRRAEATVLLFKGDASLVLGVDCVAGSLPGNAHGTAAGSHQADRSAVRYAADGTPGVPRPHAEHRQDRRKAGKTVN